MYAPRYARERATLDYAWHVLPSLARQELQDDMVDDLLRGGTPCARPWLILMAGAMGAGKSHTIRTLAAHGYLPLTSLVVVDPDHIRSRLPEWPHLVAHNPSAAGTLTHQESCTVAAIAERAAMERSMHVLVDGTLRNTAWYSDALAHVRATFPHYRIAIWLVTASEARVHERVARRTAITGRVVPRALVTDTLVTAPHSFAVLAPLVDFAATLDNERDSVALPELCVRGVSDDGAWHAFAHAFASLPHSLHQRDAALGKVPDPHPID